MTVLETLLDSLPSLQEMQQLKERCGIEPADVAAIEELRETIAQIKPTLRPDEQTALQEIEKLINELAPPRK